MTKKEIRDIVLKGNMGEYSHVIIWCDTYDYEDYPVYVKYGQDIKKVVMYYNDLNNMRKIMEVYNYNLDLEQQLDEERAYHIEPLNKQIKIVKSNEEKEPEKAKIAEGLKNYNISNNLKRAINYATKMHEGQTRLNGEPYIVHPLQVLNNVLKYKKSKNIDVLLISACLHDTLEDTSATYYDIVENFGPQVASLVLELTTDEDIKSILGKQQYLSIKMKNMSSWALDIKLCDRLANVNDLSNCDDAFKNKYVNESIGIIDYLLINAKLSKTHLTIIELILCSLFKLCENDNEKSIKIIESLEFCFKLKSNFQNENNYYNGVNKSKQIVP